LGVGCQRAGGYLSVDFDALYQTHYRRVFGLCLRLLGRAAQAEDAAQEVFVRAYRSRLEYDATAPFAAWVLRIASNHCIDLIRRRTKERDLFGDADDAIDAVDRAASSTLDALIDEQRGAEVRAAVAALPDKYRIPLTLAYYNELNYDEIAAQLGITRNHVGVLLLRARRSLRQSLATATEE
jgi:RNA polymerase sigma-70 factor (ECF subfamily)